MEWESPPSILVIRNPNWSQKSGTGFGCVKGRYWKRGRRWWLSSPVLCVLCFAVRFLLFLFLCSSVPVSLFGPPSCLPLFSCIFVPLLYTPLVLSFFFSPFWLLTPFLLFCYIPPLAFIARGCMRFQDYCRKIVTVSVHHGGEGYQPRDVPLWLKQLHCVYC